MMSACGNQNQNESDMRLQQQVDSLQTIVDNKDSELNDIIVTMTEVQNGIRRIAEAEGRVTVADGNQENVSSRAIIRDNMEYICEAMQQNRELGAQLREKLNASRFKADKLKSLVDGLQSQVESQNQRIQELQASLVEKDSTILISPRTTELEFVKYSFPKKPEWGLSGPKSNFFAIMITQRYIPSR